MLIGVTGDTHNNLKNIAKICDIFNKNSVDLVLHSGDISLPKSLLAFNRLNCSLITVLGNNDIEEEKSLRETAKKFDCKIYSEPFSIEIEDKQFSLLHHPDLINDEIDIIVMDVSFISITKKTQQKYILEYLCSYTKTRMIALALFLFF